MLERGAQLAEALAYAHSGPCDGGASMVMHRDLKAENVGFAADGSIRLFDFGLARVQKRDAGVCNARYAMTGNTVRILFLSSHQLRVDSSSACTDWVALAAVA